MGARVQRITQAVAQEGKGQHQRRNGGGWNEHLQREALDLACRPENHQAQAGPWLFEPQAQQAMKTSMGFFKPFTPISP